MNTMNIGWMMNVSIKITLITIFVIISVCCFLWGKHSEKSYGNNGIGMGYIIPVSVWLFSIIFLLIFLVYLINTA